MTQSQVRSNDRFLVFGAQAIDDAEIQDVASSIQSGRLDTGPMVELSERDFKAYKNIAYSVAVGSCTAALHLILAAGIGPGNQVISLTYVG